jgi:hypothetical protein|tara:strand:- start:1088 stop:1315 length:228 start_codon:yes stop_codon:yes gene_type:complete
MRSIGITTLTMSRKEELTSLFKEKGYERVSLRWIPSTPYGKKHKLSGWIYKISGETEWAVLGKNFEASSRAIDLL